MNCKHSFTAALVFLFLAAPLAVEPGARVFGAVTAYEGFDYAPVQSDLLGKNGGQGFTGPWVIGGFNASIHTNFDIGGGSLAYGGLVTSGNRVTTDAVGAIAGLTRGLSTQIGVPGTTRYLSFLVRPEDTLNGGAFNGFLGLYLDPAAGTDMFVGKPGGGSLLRWVLEDRGGSLQSASPDAVTVNETDLLVVRADFTAGIDKFTLYVNPVLGDPEPAVGTVKNNSDVGLVGGLTLYSTGAFSLDEIRIGDTFFDVLPVPEPTSLALAAIAVAGGFLFHRRRKSAPDHRTPTF